MTGGKALLDDLRRVDELTLRFSPLGLGGRLEPEASARFLEESIARATLVDDVPEDIRLNFERVRKLHLYGLLDYDHFTVAIDGAHLVLEAALRHRFVTYYGGSVPVLRNGARYTIEAPTFDRFFRSVRNGRRPLLAEGGGEPLPLSYGALFAWARRRRLLSGRRNAAVFKALVELRNYSAHPKTNTVDMPPESVRTLRDVAEIINKLWGHDTDGGRLYPPPVRRRVRVAALAPDGRRAVTFGSLGGVAAEPDADEEHDQRDWIYAAFLAADEEELVDRFSAEVMRFVEVTQFATTRFPCELVIGPTSRDEICSRLDELAALEDAVEFHDRLFFVRVDGVDVELPRTRDQLASVDGSSPGTWHAVIADQPLDAWHLVRTLLAGPLPEDAVAVAETVAVLSSVAAATTFLAS